MSPLKLLSILFAGFQCFSVLSQNTDEYHAKRCFTWFQELEYEDTVKARFYADSGIYFAERSGDDELIGRAHQFRGWLYQDLSDFRRARKHYYQSLEAFKRTSNKQGIADAYGNLGNAYFDMKFYQKSLEYQLKSLRENEEILEVEKDPEKRKSAREGRSYAWHNIASIYSDIDLHEKALEYEYESVKYEIEEKNEIGEAISCYALATAHKKLGNTDSAIYYYKRTIELYEGNDYEYGLAAAYFSYSSMEGSDLSEMEKREMSRKSLDLYKQTGDKDGLTNNLLNIGLRQFQSLTADSIKHLLDSSLVLIQEYDFDHFWRNFYKLRAKYNARVGEYEQAYSDFEEFVKLLEISNEEKRNHDVVAGDVRYEMQKQIDIDRAESQKKLAQQQTVISLSVLGGVILLILLFFFVSSNRRKKRLNAVLSEKNDEINEQKNIVEEHNRSISDSIAYAKRIQSAILPDGKKVKKYFPENFLMYRPKDVVSGDFYWFEVIDDRIFVAVADCTGHGVPGAMVSVVCSNALNRAVNEFRLTHTGQILDKVREIVINTLAKHDESVRDGMDIALCAIEPKEMRLAFAGANNPLWIIRSKDKINAGEEALLNGKYGLLEFKGDKQPIGEYPLMNPFNEQHIPLQPGDMLYLFSDGFIDQFGGPEGKKFKSGRLKKEVLSVCQLNMDAQCVYLEQLFDSWKHDVEQVDDVCLVGIRLPQ